MLWAVFSEPLKMVEACGDVIVDLECILRCFGASLTQAG